MLSDQATARALPGEESRPIIAEYAADPCFKGGGWPDRAWVRRKPIICGMFFGLRRGRRLRFLTKPEGFGPGRDRVGGGRRRHG